MRELKFRMVTQTTGKLLGYVDIYDLLRNGSGITFPIYGMVLEFDQKTTGEQTAEAEPCG